MKTPLPSVVFIGVALAFLTVKDLQEVAGVRLVSLIIPVLLAALYMGRLRNVVVPPIAQAYLLFGCVVLPLVSIVNQRAVTIYDIYLPLTILSAYVIIGIPYSLLGRNMEWFGNMYAGAIICMCALSYLTFTHQWFGAYTIQSFSDFRTLFALQVSLAIPFFHGRYRNFFYVLALVTLFFTNSRLSLFLGAGVVVFLMYKENKVRFLFLLPLFSLFLTALLVTTTAGNLMLTKMGGVLHIGSGASAAAALDPSDIGRLAYLVTTFDNLNSPAVIAIGHGIKTNHEIIQKNIDVSAWGLSEDMADATVHNVYIELMSDTGLLGLIPFVVFLLYIGFVIARYRGVQSKYFICFSVFTLSYMFEANYCSFFFEYAVMFFIFVAYEAKSSMPPPAVRNLSLRGLLRWIISAHGKKIYVPPYALGR
jgi:hypothetical protein